MKPVLQALLVADHVYTDKVTGKKIVAGIFHEIQFRKVNAADASEGDKRVLINIAEGGHLSGSPFCYISLTEVNGNFPFTLRYVNLADYKIIFHVDFRIENKDPIGTIEIVLPLPALPSREAGTFALELLCNDEPMGSHRINIREMGGTSDE